MEERERERERERAERGLLVVEDECMKKMTVGERGGQINTPLLPQKNRQAERGGSTPELGSSV
jgi:hypothetical protein